MRRKTRGCSCTRRERPATPKGAIRSHRGGAMLSLVTEIELGLHRDDGALLVMPMCHANSLYFFSAFAYCGATTTVYNRKSFDPEHCVRVLGDGVATFTSLVPTHYSMMLALPAGDASAVQSRARSAKLMISSAPARPDAKRAIMEMFPGRRPVRALWIDRDGLGDDAPSARAVRQAWLGRTRMRRLSPDQDFSIPNGDEVPDGEVGELYASNPYIFDGYWKLPEKTREAFRGDYCTVGDMARRDAGRLHPSRRPQEQHDHHRRRERLSIRCRGGDRAATVRP